MAGDGAGFSLQAAVDLYGGGVDDLVVGSLKTHLEGQDDPAITERDENADAGETNLVLGSALPYAWGIQWIALKAIGHLDHKTVPGCGLYSLCHCRFLAGLISPGRPRQAFGP